MGGIDVGGDNSGDNTDAQNTHEQRDGGISDCDGANDGLNDAHDLNC